MLNIFTVECNGDVYIQGGFFCPAAACGETLRNENGLPKTFKYGCGRCKSNVRFDVLADLRYHLLDCRIRNPIIVTADLGPLHTSNESNVLVDATVLQTNNMGCVHYAPRNRFFCRSERETHLRVLETELINRFGTDVGRKRINFINHKKLQRERNEACRSWMINLIPQIDERNVSYDVQVDPLITIRDSLIENINRLRREQGIQPIRFVEDVEKQYQRRYYFG